MKTCAYCGNECCCSTVELSIGLKGAPTTSRSYCTMTCLTLSLLSDMVATEVHFDYKLGMVDKMWIPVLEQFKDQLIKNTTRFDESN